MDSKWLFHFGFLRFDENSGVGDLKTATKM